MSTVSGKPIRVRLRVTGQVQGVGFRPYVYRLAGELGLTGAVSNDPAGVTIEVQGPLSAVEAFIARLPADTPPLARVDSVGRLHQPTVDEVAFVVLPSETGQGRSAGITPDTTVCADCLRELADPADRRHGYPFINCTNCGPRYTIIFDIPYDRAATTMAGFKMCSHCAAEYHDPASRRFHAQPNACPVCGPHVELVSASRLPKSSRLRKSGEAAITAAAAALKNGRIVAVRGLGGFHLACLASDGAAVGRLRERKRREAKPLAIMAASLDHVRSWARITRSEEAALTSIERPIVLLRKRLSANKGDIHLFYVSREGTRGRFGRKRDECPLFSAVAPASPYVGVMLPYTPLHVLLLEAVGAPLVMTSGNVTEEPICRTTREAAGRLGDIADFVLTHNRPIYTACDDSVVREDVGRVRVLRRSRGYVPGAIDLPIAAPRPILAGGPELKNTVALAAGRRCVLSHHIGDLKNARAEAFFHHAIDTLSRTLDVQPEIVAHDLHPHYLSTRYAEGLAGVERVAVQHHHAHAASVMAEHGLTGEVIGLVCDGTGYGEDGATWGCEFLVADERGFRRAGHLRYAALPGGDRAAEEPWRMALSWLRQACGDGAEKIAADLFADIDAEKRRVVFRMLERTVNCPPASSLGRLFDAVSALAGVCQVHRYEAQAAIELEAAMDSDVPGEYDWAESAGFVIDPAPMIRGVAADRRAGVSVGVVSAKFHRTVASFLVAGVERVRSDTGLARVAVSGGSFQNAFLLREVHDRLVSNGFDVFLHERVPPNDGGIALGQAYVAAARLGFAGGG